VLLLFNVFLCMCVCVCMYVCMYVHASAGERSSARLNNMEGESGNERRYAAYTHCTYHCVYVYVCMYMYVCMYVCRCTYEMCAP
jgi:hypothetical protein